MTYRETLVENRQFELTPRLFGDPLCVTPLEFGRHVWHQQTTRVPGLSYGVVCVILRLAVLVQYGTGM